MGSFLGNVAKGLYGHYGNDISSLRIVMPNMRSRLFFKNELSQIIDKPIWQPKYLSVDDLMGDISALRSVDRIRAIVELYKVWIQYHDESFDKFYYWGEMLLNDFDQIDKYMIDASSLFRNVNDLKSIGDDFSYFNDEQRGVLARFWSVFDSDSEVSQEKERFVAIWNTLLPVYNSYRERLLSLGVAYQGMIYRAAAEKIEAGEVYVEEGVGYAVVGFNALSKSEKILFDFLQNAYRADFFWDYDDYYISERSQEAGLFLRENIVRYPQPAYSVNSTDNFVKKKNIRAVSLSSDSMQCKYVTDYLRLIEEKGGNVGKETAIVLTNEELLIPLLYSLPENISDINVTMGYPLRRTLEYSFVERLLKLQSNARLKGNEESFYHSDVVGLLSHPFVVGEVGVKAEELRKDIIDRSYVYVKRSYFDEIPLLERIFTTHAKWSDLLEYLMEIVAVVSKSDVSKEYSEYEKMLRVEFLSEIAGALRKLFNSLKDCEITINTSTVAILARRMLQNIRIPYSGEPLCGLQVMGILETRNLDFENVLILSMNDDNFPGNTSSASSFIPYNLRVGYGLPTPQYHDGVYAYYFYRLLQRTRNAELVYSSSIDEDSSGEPSRYILQLKYESPHKVDERGIDMDVTFERTQAIAVEKSEDIADVLNKYTQGSRTLSPSALNTYLDCPLKFYFRYVAYLKPEDEVAEDVDNALFGSILHRAMELLYEPLVGAADPAECIGVLIGSGKVDDAVEQAIGDVVYNGERVLTGDLEGNVLLVRDIVVRYINNNILPFDRAQRGYKILKLEADIEGLFEFDGSDDRRCSLRLKGQADRIDLLDDGIVRIIDYKTGSPQSDFAGLENLFGSDSAKRNGAVLQTFVYSMIARQMQLNGKLVGEDVQPALYYIRMMNEDDYSPMLADQSAGDVESVSRYEDDLRRLLGEKMKELFDLSEPFSQCENSQPCRYCDYKTICRRE